MTPQEYADLRIGDFISHFRIYQVTNIHYKWGLLYVKGRKHPLNYYNCTIIKKEDMTQEQAMALIIERAEELSKEPFVKAEGERMLREGRTENEVKDFIYNLAVATLVGLN